MISFDGTVGNALYSSIIGYLYDGTGNYDLMLILTIGFTIITVISELVCYAGENRKTIA